MQTFSKPFTQQEAISDEAIERAVEVMRSGRLTRYNTLEGETAEAALLEQEFADYMGQPFCLACASGGYALHVALKATGLEQGAPVLCTASPCRRCPVPSTMRRRSGAGGDRR